jgi:cold shock CspA family protein
MTDRKAGIIKAWHAQRGFGFILAGHGERDVFAHVSQWVEDVQPTAGATVTYLPGSDAAGRPCAKQIMFQ